MPQFIVLIHRIQSQKYLWNIGGKNMLTLINLLNLLTLFRERDFTLNGKILFSASVLSSKFKAIIRQGLQKKRISWEYLASDNFFALASHAMVPMDKLLAVTEYNMLRSHSKPKMSSLLTILAEEFWRPRGLPSGNKYSPAVAKMLFRLGIVLPFDNSGEILPCFNETLMIYLFPTIRR